MRYLFMRVDLKEDEATVCYPPNAVFHEAVQKGQLKGKVDKDKNGNPALVTLEDHGQLEKFIQAHGAGELFKLDQAHVFRRLRKEKKAAAAAHSDKAPDKANEELNR
ncbi:MAG: hypothetical protein K8T25_21515 [Planctomycetia bacterium]|nr:hypothetical protein [Planctomycetia bacterium]